MKEGSPLDARAAALRVKDLARDLATELAEGYRKSTRYFKLRAAVVGAWVVLSLATLWLACPGSGLHNSLGAEAQLFDGGGMGPQLALENTSDGIWTDVVLTLDDGWTHAIPTIRSGQRVVVALEKFTKGGASAPADWKPRQLTISCGQGKARTSLDIRR